MTAIKKAQAIRTEARRREGDERLRLLSEHTVAAGHVGLTSNALAKLVGWAHLTTWKRLQHLQTQGIVERSSRGNAGAVWGAVGIRAAKDAEHKAELALREDDPLPPRRRTIPAAGAPPLKVRGPNAVWELGDKAKA